MQPLPDLVPPEPSVVFCGRAGVQSPRHREHYYETPGNAFWELLHDSGFTPRRLRPQDDVRLPGYGLGLTDLVGHREPYAVHVDDLVAKVERWRPDWLAFTSRAIAHEAAQALGAEAAAFRRAGLGPHEWYVGEAQVYVLPGCSGANRRPDYDGRPDRLGWWRDLAMLAGRG